MRGLAEGALITAIYFVLLWLTIYTPIGIVTTLILATPFIVMGARHDTRAVILTVVASILVAGLLTGISGILLTISFGAIGTVMGLSYQKKKSGWTALSLGFLTTIASYILMLAISFYVFDINIIEWIQKITDESLDISRSIAGGTDETWDMLEKSLDMIIALLPAILILSAIISTMITHIVGTKILKRLGLHIGQLPPFKDWKLPRILLFYYLISLLLTIIPGVKDIQWIETIALNSIYIISMLLMVQGVSFVSYFADAKGWGKSAPIFAVIGIVILARYGFPYFISLLGMIDLGFDIRGKVKRKN